MESAKVFLYFVTFTKDSEIFSIPNDKNTVFFLKISKGQNCRELDEGIFALSH